MVIGTSTVLGVLVYSAACWARWARPARDAPEPQLAEVVSLPVRAAQTEPELDLAA
jgi:hypothetical protein